MRNTAKEIKDLNHKIKGELFKMFPKPDDHPSFSEIHIMDYILKHEDQVIYSTDLVENLNLKKSSIAEILGTMEEKGIIERVADKVDKRKKQIVLTKKSKDNQEKIHKVVDSVNERLIKGISKEDIETFHKVLEKMRENLD